MNAMDRSRIGRAFSYARDYDGHARVQRIVARKLARRIAALPLPAAPRLLEIGCGTGFLTRALIELQLGGQWLVTDISPRMVERCRENAGTAPGRGFAVLDGECGDPGPAGPFDLICSSLAMQWFDDQESAVSRMLDWLALGGHCLFTTLADGSFAEWRRAHEEPGLTPGTRPLLPVSAFSRMLPQAQAEPCTVDRLIDRHGNALEFLRALRTIGATTSKAGHKPLATGALRRVMRNFEAGGAATTYEVVTCHFRRADDPA